MSSCQDHLSLKSIHCRSQTFVSVAYKVRSSAISETLLISAVHLLFFRKTNIFLLQTCYQLIMFLCFEPEITPVTFVDWAFQVPQKNISNVLSQAPLSVTKLIYFVHNTIVINSYQMTKQ